MTNEEAIENLRKLLFLYDDGMIDFSVIRESINVAIKALKKQDVPDINVANTWIPYYDQEDIPDGRYLVQCEDGEMYTGTMTGFGWVFRNYVPRVVAYRELPEAYKESDR